MYEVLVNRLGGLSLPRKSVIRLTDRPDMTIITVDVKQYNTTTTTTALSQHLGKKSLDIIYMFICPSVLIRNADNMRICVF